MTEPILTTKPTYIKVKFLETLDEKTYTTKGGTQQVSRKILVQKILDTVEYLTIQYNHHASLDRLDMLDLNDEFVTSVKFYSIKSKSGNWFNVITGYGVWKDESSTPKDRSNLIKPTSIPEHFLDAEPDDFASI